MVRTPTKVETASEAYTQMDMMRIVVRSKSSCTWNTAARNVAATMGRVTSKMSVNGLAQ